jgi:hypothetical protein
MKTKTDDNYATIDDIGFIGGQSPKFTDEDREALREFFAERKQHPFAAPDDIGRRGIENHVAPPENKAFFAKKASEYVPKGYEIPAPGAVCAVAEPQAEYAP